MGETEGPREALIRHGAGRVDGQCGEEIGQLHGKGKPSVTTFLLFHSSVLPLRLSAPPGVFSMVLLTSLKLEIEAMMSNVVSGYDPQVGCELEKEKFWSTAAVYVCISHNMASARRHAESGQEVTDRCELLSNSAGGVVYPSCSVVERRGITSRVINPLRAAASQQADITPHPIWASIDVATVEVPIYCNGLLHFSAFDIRLMARKMKMAGS
ncbi:hypothetical protein Q8A73_004211 [Channa argus]|nr:hypothetical protein Q8A73_004211 [Channa argus]